MGLILIIMVAVSSLSLLFFLIGKSRKGIILSAIAIFLFVVGIIIYRTPFKREIRPYKIIAIEMFEDNNGRKIENLTIEDASQIGKFKTITDTIKVKRPYLQTVDKGSKSSYTGYIVFFTEIEGAVELWLNSGFGYIEFGGKEVYEIDNYKEIESMLQTEILQLK